MPDRSAPTPRRRRDRIFVGLYLGLLLVSHGVRRLPGVAGPVPTNPTLSLRAVDRARALDRPIRVAYLDALQGPSLPGADPVLLLHGSPGSLADFTTVAPTLARGRRVIAPDLPGFGGSERDVPDYSIEAHARYALQLLDALGVERVHLVGFSMGGGVALEIAHAAPERVRSVTLLSAIGVQELELFGDARLNHLVHGAQLAALWLVREGVPHMGRLDRVMLGVPYARNFFDTDQRPLRGILRSLEAPVYVLHGRDDFLVPVEAAIEHARIAPHSELEVVAGSHFLVFLRGPETAARIASFLERVESGRARTRARAAPDRVASAAAPWDPAAAPALVGLALILMLGLLAAATLVSEDLASIGAGLLVAQGRIGLLPAIAACGAGILAGDLLLFLAGRVVGRPALRRAPFRWFVREPLVDEASAWFERRGPIVIGFSRFVPGLRLPTYFAAGMLHTSFWRFAGWFALAVAVWTPLIVGLSAVAGERAFGWLERFRRHAPLAAVIVAAVFLVLLKLVVPLFTMRGRRRLAGRFGRIRHWEFWPPWLFYPPVVAWVLWLGLRHRSMLLFTAANPAMPAGGFIAESKRQILDGLHGAGERVARTAWIAAATPADARIAIARETLGAWGVGFPVVLKPDAGQRGSGVAIVRDEATLERRLREARYDLLLQEYVPGLEFGVFYVRMPREPRGRIFSVTEKVMPVLRGDGRSTIEELILRDRRAVCMAEQYMRIHATELGRVPSDGEPLRLVELGTHCRGAIFLDGRRLATPELTHAIDAVATSYEGFFFGRFDIRVDSADALARGDGFKVIELNGVTSEATHIYDPAIGLFEAWRTLFEQWRLAFEIGRRNRDLGARPASLAELARAIVDYRRLARSHPA